MYFLHCIDDVEVERGAQETNTSRRDSDRHQTRQQTLNPQPDIGLRFRISWISEIVRGVSDDGKPGRIESRCFVEFSICCTFGITRETYGEMSGS